MENWNKSVYMKSQWLRTLLRCSKLKPEYSPQRISSRSTSPFLSPPRFFIFVWVMSPFQSTSCTWTGDLICWAGYKGDLEGRFDWGVQNPGEKSGLMESSKWDYFAFFTTPTPLTAGWCCKWSACKSLVLVGGWTTMMRQEIDSKGKESEGWRGVRGQREIIVDTEGNFRGVA